MKLGIIGLPNAGKSTLFNAITEAGAMCASYPFTTIEPNVGTVHIPDSRVENLAKIFGSHKAIHATVEFVDIAGLVKGASKGEGLGNKFLSNIREVDAVLHVLRYFEDRNVSHVEGSIDPLRDMEIVNIELMLADLETVKKRLDKAIKLARLGERHHHSEIETLESLKTALEAGKPARMAALTDEMKFQAEEMFLLTSKPVIYAININEELIGNISSNEVFAGIKAAAAAEGAAVMEISARFEEDVSQLADDEKASFLHDAGLEESGLDRLIKTGYILLDLISFFTANQNEAREWSIIRGTKAVKAAGKVHSDFEKGFIRAEIIPYKQLETCESFSSAREKGFVRSEGRDYVMHDGDVALFRFNL